MNRRHFLGRTTTAAASLTLGAHGRAQAAADSSRPAALGGAPAQPEGFPGWPVFDRTEEDALLEVLHSRHWFRGSGKSVAAFEQAFQQLTGAPHCVATSSGTAALTTALGALDIGPGDEVILPPYTFVATWNVIVLNFALPVFADIDLETFQVDPARVEAAITPQTKALLPVHIGGSPADLDALLETGRKHRAPVIEDACQAHLAEWRGRQVGTWGLGGCFSFQASKNLNCGEGGAVLTGDADFANRCYNFHTQGRGRPVMGPQPSRGTNLRLSEFQGRLLRAQMTRVLEQARRRTANADHLTALLRDIPGIAPARLYPGVTRSAYHLYMFRYDKAQFANLDRSRFLTLLGKEGVPASGGYGPMHRDSWITGLAGDRHFLRIYGETRMKEWREKSLECPANDRLCQEAVWFTQNMLLGPRSDMDRIADAIRKIQKHAGDLARG